MIQCPAHGNVYLAIFSYYISRSLTCGIFRYKDSRLSYGSIVYIENAATMGLDSKIPHISLVFRCTTPETLNVFKIGRCRSFLSIYFSLIWAWKSKFNSASLRNCWLKGIFRSQKDDLLPTFKSSRLSGKFRCVMLKPS